MKTNNTKHLKPLSDKHGPYLFVFDENNNEQASKQPITYLESLSDEHGPYLFSFEGIL